MPIKKGGVAMAIENTESIEVESIQAIDDELADVLTAISVITKRLAQKIKDKQKSKEDKKDVQALRTDGRDRKSET